MKRWAHSVPLALAAYSYTRFRLPSYLSWHFDCGAWRKAAAERVESANELPFLSYPSWLLSLEFLNRGTRP
jgi:hypothetical protein